MNNKKIIATTSWDDGNILDKKLATLLDKYGFRGTFYVALNWHNRLSEADIKNLSLIHEIGAHTLNHPNLCAINIQDAEKEIRQSKASLENIIGKPVRMFAYPFGSYNDEIKNLVKSSGFIGARTTEKWITEAPDDYFKMGTTTHFYPHPVRENTESIGASFKPFFGNIGAVFKFRISPAGFFSLPKLARGIFDYVYKNGGIYHLWGHSWEIEKYNLWGNLEDLLKYISSHEDIEYLTNGEIV